MLNEIVTAGAEVGETPVYEVPVSDVPESEFSVEVSSEPLYCLCQEPWDIHNRRFMINCDHCSDWFHGTCVGVTQNEARGIKKYHCPKCFPTVGPSIYLGNLSSDPSFKRAKSLRCTPEFIEKLKEYKFNIPDEVVLKMRGQALTLPWLISKGFTRPILIETTDGLGIKLPVDSFTVFDVERYVGSERMVDVIDVERQADDLMSLREFTEYFTSPSRKKVLNLISLEFTHTNLNKLVEAPYIARKLDWVANYWPSSSSTINNDDVTQRPAVSKYCLMSVKGSYTDFHIDFGGTSVWYHVLWGEKIFYLIEPSEANLNIYQRWMNGEMGDQCFLADEVQVCFRCVLKKGQTMLIPTGWIHAVYTPEDSLVFGGNFLHLLNMDLQLQIYQMEKDLNTPSKYLFPSFEASHWFAANGLIQDLQMLNVSSFIPSYLIKGLKAFIVALKSWAAEKDMSHIRREDIPSKLNSKKILQELSKQLRLSEKRLHAPLGPKEMGHKEAHHTEQHKPSKELKRKESVDHSYRVERSRETSPTTSESKKEPLKLLISRSSTVEFKPKTSPSISPNLPSSNPNPSIKLKIKKQPSKQSTYNLHSPLNIDSGVGSQDSDRVVGSSSSPCSSPKEPRLKIRLSLTELKSDTFDCDSNGGSDALYIVESDRDELKIDTDASMMSSEDLGMDGKRGHRKRHHKKCKKKSGKGRHDREQNKAINDVLAGTLDGIEELFKSSNYSERISQCESTSQAIKDAVANLDAMKGTILRKKAKEKHRKRKAKDDADEEMFENRGHQDDDYVYLPLTGSDDESSPRKAKNKRGRKKEDDESWSPRAKVGQVGKREAKSSRVNAKREGVKKCLEDAAKEEGENSKAKKKRKSDGEEEVKVKKLKNPKLVPSADNLLSAGPSSSTGGGLSWNLTSKYTDPTKKVNPEGKVVQRKPKKGMATPKQRLGKILKINKFARF